MRFTRRYISVNQHRSKQQCRNTFLNDLFILGRLQEVGSIKVNKSEIARELGVDRRTVSKYIDGYSKCDTRKEVVK